MNPLKTRIKEGIIRFLYPPDEKVFRRFCIMCWIVVPGLMLLVFGITVNYFPMTENVQGIFGLIIAAIFFAFLHYIFFWLFTDRNGNKAANI